MAVKKKTGKIEVVAAYLKITTWLGTIAMGTHHYGRIFYEWKPDRRAVITLTDKPKYRLELPVEHTLKTAAEVKAASDEDYQYEKGDVTSRFEDRDTVIASAIELFEKEFMPRGAEYLIEGDHGNYEPQRVVVGKDPKVVAKINELTQQARENNYWEDDEKKMKAICGKWSAIAKKAKIIKL